MRASVAGMTAAHSIRAAAVCSRMSRPKLRSTTLRREDSRAGPAGDGLVALPMQVGPNWQRHAVKVPPTRKLAIQPCRHRTSSACRATGRKRGRQRKASSCARASTRTTRWCPATHPATHPAAPLPRGPRMGRQFTTCVMMIARRVSGRLAIAQQPSLGARPAPPFVTLGVRARPDGRLDEMIRVEARPRHCTLERKLALLEEVSRSGASVAVVTDRHDLGRSLSFKRRRQVCEETMRAWCVRTQRQCRSASSRTCAGACRPSRMPLIRPRLTRRGSAEIRTSSPGHQARRAEAVSAGGIATACLRMRCRPSTAC